ncbi:hypothetical protein [Pseudoxanthomonas indica]|uniref:hypothetical protein n=1 Tax=Pseudoxanthomonas indica TaxID=428993 RepID=UPI00166BA980|nr:hypothetical protein [Pseudoxanthomonas indica]
MRQRRDLYAIAIGLCIYNLAGGYVQSDTTVASIIPVKLSHPWVVLLAAWIGFAYFWWRFWLVSEAQPIADFHQDATWQAGNSRAGRELAAEHAGPTQLYGNARSADESAAQIRTPTGPIAIFSLEKWKPSLSLADLRYNGKKETRLTESFGTSTTPLDRRYWPRFWHVYLLGYVRAMYRERAFSDYTAPHLFAVFTVLTGLWHMAVHWAPWR